MKRGRRSPLSNEPLRVPGQSVDEHRNEIVLDKMIFPAILALQFGAFAGMEWWKYYKGLPPQPVIFTVMALIGFGYAAFQWRRAVPRVRQLWQAADGERIVSEHLEDLRERGFQILHDVIGDGFNVDHLVVGETGVFTVETKTISKPVSGDARVAFDGETGFSADSKPCCPGARSSEVGQRFDR